MMLYPCLLRPLLFLLPAETAHDCTLMLLARLARLRRLMELGHAILGADQSAIRLAGLEFPNRVGLAGGLDKNAVALRAWWALGFGFVEVGTVTPRPQPGNPKPRMFRLTNRRAIVNRMGFNNDGADVVAARLSERPRPAFPIGVSLGKQASTPVDDLPRVAADYGETAAKLSPMADFLTVNVSSPNTAGLRGLQSGLAIRAILQAVGGRRPVFVKLAPELEGHALRGVAEAALSAGAEGLIATNTLALADAAGTPRGGLSGRPLARLALERVAELRTFIGNRVPIIGVGGIDSPAAARAMLNAGADLIQVYTGLVYEGPLLVARLARALRQPGSSTRKQAPTPWGGGT